MNIATVKSAVTEIEKNEAALKWLLEWGKHVQGVKDEVDVAVRINYASAHVGASETQAVLASMVVGMIPEIAKRAIDNCRHTIEVLRATIAKEVACGLVPEGEKRDG